MKSVALPLILVLGGIVAAQIPASLPSSAPATLPGADTAPATSTAPVTLPTTAEALAATQAATAPTTESASSTTGPAATWPATTQSGLAASEPSSRPSFSNPFLDRRDFRFSPPMATRTPGGPDLTPKTYPRAQYGAMLGRSIFIKGRQYVTDTHVDPISGNSSRQGATTIIVPPSYVGVENVLVFNGASNANGQLVAFIENTGMNQIARYHVGDPVGQGAQGKVAAITLDSMDYQVGARVTHVNLGQNLNGQDVQIQTTQPVAEGAAPGAGSTSTTQGATPSGGPGSLDEVMRRLRERRMKELGQ